MLSWIVIIGGLLMSFYHADLYSEDELYSVWAPVGCIVFSIALLTKFVINFEWARTKTNSSAGGSGYHGFGGDGGGDCGGGGGGGE